MNIAFSPPGAQEIPQRSTLLAEATALLRLEGCLPIMPIKLYEFYVC